MSFLLDVLLFIIFVVPISCGIVIFLKEAVFDVMIRDAVIGYMTFWVWIVVYFLRMFHKPLERWWYAYKIWAERKGLNEGLWAIDVNDGRHLYFSHTQPHDRGSLR